MTSSIDLAEFSTPSDVCALVAKLAVPPNFIASGRVSVYDPAVGRGGLVDAVTEQIKTSDAAAEVQSYGQDTNSDQVAGIGPHIEARHGNTLLQDLFPNQSFDFVVSNPPFGCQWTNLRGEIEAERKRDGTGRYAPGLPSSQDSSLLFVLHTLSKIRRDVAKAGRGALLLGAAPMSRSGADAQIRKWILESGLLEGIVKLAPGVLPYTAITPYVWLLAADRSRCHVRYVDASDFATRMRRSGTSASASYSAPAVEEIAALYFSSDLRDVAMDVPVADLAPSTESANSKFGADYSVGFSRIKWERAARQIERLGSVYPSFDQRLLGEVCRISRANPSPTDSADAVLHINPATLQVSTSGEKRRTDIALYPSHEINPSFLAAYLNSELGQLHLEAVQSGDTMRTIRTDQLACIPIPCPDQPTQTSIVSNLELADKLAAQVADVRSQLVLNPHDRGILDQLLDLSATLTKEEKVLANIRHGESARVEFKQTLFENTHTGKKDSQITEAALKNVAAFLNSDGGNLLVGVSDDGRITGIDAEIDSFYRGSTDRYQLGFKDAVKSAIDESFFDHIQWQIVPVNGASVLLVEVQASPRPCYFGKAEEFYIRTNPAAEKLMGSKLVNYVNTHFGNSHG